MVQFKQQYGPLLVKLGSLSSKTHTVVKKESLAGLDLAAYEYMHWPLVWLKTFFFLTEDPFFIIYNLENLVDPFGECDCYILL